MDMQTFHQHVTNLLSPEKATREGSEAVLGEFLKASPKNYQALEAIAKSDQCSDATRQISIIYLRQYITARVLVVEQHGAEQKSTEVNNFDIMDPEDIAHILEFSVEMIFQNPNNAVKRAAVVLLAKFCRCCSKADFERILTSLAAFLVEGQEAYFALACKCICEIASDCQSDHSRILILVRTVYELTRNIFLACPRENATLIRYIIRFNCICLESIGLVNFQYGESATSDEEAGLIRIYVSEWGKILVDWAEKVTDLNTLVTTEASSYIVLFKSLQNMLEYFKDAMTDELPQTILSCAWRVLTGLKDFYIAKYISNPDAEEDDSTNGYTSDGDRVDVDVVVSQLFELFAEGINMMNHKDIDSVFGAEWVDLLDAIIKLMQFPSSMITKYNEEGNEFISEVANESDSYSVRTSGREILYELKKPEYVFLYIQKELAALYPSFQTSTYQQQIQIESLLFALETIKDQFSDYINSDKTRFSPSDVGSSLSLIFQTIITEPNFNAWLKASAISLYGSLRHLFGVDYTLSIFEAVFKFMTSPAPLAFHLQLIESFISPIFSKPRVLDNRCSRCNPDGNPDQAARCSKCSRLGQHQSFHDELVSKVTAPTVHELMSAVLIVSESCNEDTGHIPIIAIGNLTKIFSTVLDSDFILKVSQAVINKLFDNKNDLEFVLKIESICSSFASNPSGVGILIVRNFLLPFFHSIFTQSESFLQHLWDAEFSSKIIRKVFSSKMVDDAVAQRNSLKNEVLTFFMQVLVSSTNPHIVKEILKIFNSVLSSCICENSYVEVLSPDLITGVFSASCAVISKVLSVCVGTEANSMDDREFKTCLKEAMGLASILIMLNKDIVDNSMIISLVGQILQVFKDDSAIEHNKNIILTAMIHLTARCPATVFSVLNTIQGTGGFENIFMELLTYWGQIHTTINNEDTRYTSRISSLGLLEVAKVLGNSPNNSALVTHIVELVCHPIELGVSFNENLAVNEDDDKSEIYEASDYDDDDDDEEGNYDEDDEEGGFQLGGSGAAGGGGGGGGGVFVDAADYFGDNVSDYEGDDNDIPNGMTFLPARLIFNPIQSDPLASVDIDEYFKQSLQQLGYGASDDLSTPPWFDPLSQESKSKIIALFSS